MVARIVLVITLFGAIAACTPTRMQIVTPHPVLPTGDFASTNLVITPLTSPEGARGTPDDLPRRVGALFAASGASILDERQLASVPPRSYLVRIALTDTPSDGQTNDRVRREFEVTAFDVAGAGLARVATEAGIVPMIDVTGRSAMFHLTYEVVTETRNSGVATGEEESANDEQLRALTAELLYAQLAPDLQHAIRQAEFQSDRRHGLR